MRFEHDPVNKTLKRLPPVTTEGLTEPPSPSQVSVISEYRAANSIFSSPSPTPASIESSDSIIRSLDNNDYLNISERDEYIVQSPNVYSRIFGSESTHSTRSAQMIHDMKSNSTYCYILWSCWNSSLNRYELIITRLTNDFDPVQDYIVAFNKNYNAWSGTDGGFGQDASDFVRRTAVIMPDIDGDYVYVAFIQRKEILALDYNPGFPFGATQRVGLIVWRGTSHDLASGNGYVFVYNPATDIDITETDGYVYDGATDEIRLAFIQENSSTNVSSLYYGTIDEPAFTTAVTTPKKSFSVDDDVRLPQIEEVDHTGTPVPVAFYSRRVESTKDCEIWCTALTGAGDLPQATCSTTIYLTDSAQYYALTKPDSNVVIILYYDKRTSPSTEYYMKAIRRVWDFGGILATQDIKSYGSNDHGGHIEGEWEGTSAIFTIAYGKTTSPIEQYKYNDVVHAAFRSPFTNLADNDVTQPGGIFAMPRGRKYCMTNYYSRICSAHDSWDSVATVSYMGVSVPGFGGIFCKMDMGADKYNSYTDVLVGVMGASSKLFSTPPVNTSGIHITIWDEGAISWSNINGGHQSRGYSTPTSLGVGAEAAIGTGAFVDKITTKVLYFIVTNNGVGALRDPVQTDINYLQIQPRDDENAIIVTKDTDTLLLSPVNPPSHVLATAECEMYDDESTHEVLATVNSGGTLFDLDGISNVKLAQPFFINHPENIEITDVTLKLGRTAVAPTDELYVGIARWFPTGSESEPSPSILIGQSDPITPSSISVSPSWFPVNLSTTLVTHPGAIHCIFIWRTVPSATEYVSWESGADPLDACIAYRAYKTPNDITWELLPGLPTFTLVVRGSTFNSFTLEASRNGGADWKALALNRFDRKSISSETPELKRYLVKGYADFRGEPSGSNILTKATIKGNKFDIRTLALHWR